MYKNIVKVFRTADVSSFKEEEHPRDETGKFTKGSTGSNQSKNKNYSSEEIDPDYINPINDITDRDKYDALVYDFKTRGYNGRPILAVQYGDNDFQALTGSHRILAAREAGIDIPVKIIKYSDELDELLNSNDDDEKERILKELYEEGEIDEEAVDLFSEEIERNYEDFGNEEIENEYKQKAEKLKEMEKEELQDDPGEESEKSGKEKEMKEYKDFYNKLVEKYGEDKMWDDMSDSEMDEIFRLEAKAFK